MHPTHEVDPPGLQGELLSGVLFFPEITQYQDDHEHKYRPGYHPKRGFDAGSDLHDILSGVKTIDVIIYSYSFLSAFQKIIIALSIIILLYIVYYRECHL